MAEQNKTQGTKPVRHDRQDDRQRDKDRATPYAAIYDRGKEAAEHDRGDQKPKTGASLGNLEFAGRDLNYVTVGEYRDAEKLKPVHGERGREGLQRRNQKFAERHQKKEKKQRRHQRPKDPPAEYREQQNLEQQNGTQLRTLCNVEQGGGKPQSGCRRQKQQRPP